MQTAPFIPHPMLPGGQLQTMAGQLLPTRAALGGMSEETVTLPDGDRLLLHVNAPAVPNPALPMVLLLHGLGGDSDSSYMLRLTTKLNALGYLVLRFNHRGCGPGAGLLAKGIYHAGRTEDLAATLTYLDQVRPGRPYCVAAFSLSGSLMLRYLGDLGTALKHPGLRRALAVCPPVDLEQCSLALAMTRNWHIDRFYMRNLLAAARERGRLHPHLELPALPRRMTLRLFDELYTAPKGGFLSRNDYYERSSAKHVTGQITIPTVVLAAADDPIVPPHSFTGVSLGRHVTLRMERSGGHMGFIAAKPTRFGDRRWMDAAVIDWVQAPGG